MTASQTLAKHRYRLQFCFVAIATIVCVLLTDTLAFRAPANLFWMVGLPVAVGMIANVGWDRRCFMSIALLVESVLVEMFVGVLITSYG